MHTLYTPASASPQWNCITAYRNADLQPSNLLMGVDDETVLAEYKKDEKEHPSPRKVLSDRTVYLSRPLPPTYGPPVLCDCDEARSGDKEHFDDIMPDPYRAPEVILGMRWSYEFDIWNVAMVVRRSISHFHVSLR